MDCRCDVGSHYVPNTGWMPWGLAYRFKDAVDWWAFEVVMPIESIVSTFNSNQFFLNGIVVKIPKPGHFSFKLFHRTLNFYHTEKLYLFIIQTLFYLITVALSVIKVIEIPYFMI